ncbi:MAG: SAVED domain-containing protein, partial [Nitrososphaerota archaeon]
EDEIPKIAGEVYKVVKELASGGKVVNLVLSGPLGLAFQIGQLIGLSHFKVQVYQFSAGRYKPVPPVSREVMF